MLNYSGDRPEDRPRCIFIIAGGIGPGILSSKIRVPLGQNQFDFATTGHEPRGATKGESCASPLWKPHG